jgi:cytochrome c-type biogenesis protein
MISGSITLAFAAGMVATFNPCGFSLLPAYIGAFVAGDQVTDRADKRVLRAVGVAASVSVGFIVVFTAIGVIIESIAGELRRQLPWVTIVIGVALLVAGAAMALGWKPMLAIRGPQFSTKTNTPKVMVGYGITYAIASLSCTIGPFLAVTGTAAERTFFEGIATYVAYALGMGTIILVLGIASALAHTAVASNMRRISRVAPRIGGALMMLAGAYAIWYGRWELNVYNGNVSTDPVIDTMEDIRLWFVNAVQNLGAGRIGIAALGIILAVVLVARRRRPEVSVESAPAPSAQN